MDALWFVFKEFEEATEGYFEATPKWKLILGTALFTVGTSWIVDLIHNRDELVKSVKKLCFQLFRQIPPIRKKIQQEMEIARVDIRNNMYQAEETEIISFLELPSKGRSVEEIFEIARQIFRMGKFEWKNGKVSGAVNSGFNDECTDLMVKIFEMFAWSNPLHADVFPGVRKMEAEIVRMTAKIFHGDDDVVGTMTSGGTESLVMIMKAYRDWGRDVKGITKPEVVAPETIHAAVGKGVELLGYKFRPVRINPRSTTAPIKDIERAITKNTVLLLASAPGFAHGTIDDIEEMSALGLKYGIPLHIDCCLGGFILPFMNDAGFPVKPFDFRVPGVTSISADTHKFGLAPKGSSVILYRSKEYLHHQYFVAPDWPGGIYATPTITGSRPGVNVAMCWATLLYNGYDGYVDITRKIISVATEVRDEIKKSDDLFVYGDPPGPVISFGSDKFNIVQVSDTMVELGWHLQALQTPPGMHIFFTGNHTGEGVGKRILEDLKKAIENVKANPQKNDGWAKIYGLSQSLPDKSIIVEMVKLYLDIYYTSAVEK